MYIIKIIYYNIHVRVIKIRMLKTIQSKVEQLYDSAREKVIFIR